VVDDDGGHVSHFYVDEKKLVPYIVNVKKDVELAAAVARRCRLPDDAILQHTGIRTEAASTAQSGGSGGVERK